MIYFERKDKITLKHQSFYRSISKNRELYLIIAPAIIWYIIFCYIPMYGVQIAFKDYMASRGIWGSPWVGLKHFNRFFNGYYAERLIKNTIGISVYSLAVGFPIPIILALMVNELRHKKLKKFVQTVTYAPHFLSVVVLVGMLFVFLDPKTGLINNFRNLLGKESVAYMLETSAFKTVYVLSGVWQNAGWSSIIYIAALSGIDPQLHEAAIVDGATKIQRIRHINIPGIIPTIVILLIMNSGSIMTVGFEKVFLMQNNINMESSDVISTYVYRSGLMNAQFSFSTAVGLFNSVINFFLLVIVNKVSRTISEVSLW